MTIPRESHGVSGAAAEGAAAPRSGPELRDAPADDVQVLSSERVYEGHVWDVRSERFRFGDGELTRDYLDHPGAVATLAIDAHDRVLFIRQYRHAIAHRDWEIPAGLMDQAGETPLAGAQRELAEEADLCAERWGILLDMWTSPGGSTEAVRVFLARGLSPADETFAREAEEADLLMRWVPLDEAVEAVLAGHVQNALAAAAVLAAQASRQREWATLRATDSPWPSRRAARGERSN